MLLWLSDKWYYNQHEYVSLINFIAWHTLPSAKWAYKFVSSCNTLFCTQGCNMQWVVGSTTQLSLRAIFIDPLIVCMTVSYIYLFLLYFFCFYCALFIDIIILQSADRVKFYQDLIFILENYTYYYK